MKTPCPVPLVYEIAAIKDPILASVPAIREKIVDTAMLWSTSENSLSIEFSYLTQRKSTYSGNSITVERFMVIRAMNPDLLELFDTVVFILTKGESAPIMLKMLAESKENERA